MKRTLKTIIGILLVYLILFHKPYLVEAYEIEKPDFIGHIGENDIYEWIEKQYIDVDEYYNIDAFGNLKRAHFSHYVNSIFTYTYKKPEVVPTFRDLSTSYWAYNSLMNLYNIGVLKSKTDTEMKPESPITKEELAEMLVKFFNLKGTSKIIYKDSNKISSTAKIYFETLAANNIQFPVDNKGNLSSSSNINRADFIYILNQFIKRVEEFPTVKIKSYRLPISFTLENGDHLPIYEYFYSKQYRIKKFNNNNTNYYVYLPNDYKNQNIKMNVVVDGTFEKKDIQLVDREMLAETRKHDKDAEPNSSYIKFNIDTDEVVPLYFKTNSSKKLFIGDYVFHIYIQKYKEDYIFRRDDYSNVYLEREQLKADSILFTVDAKYTINGEPITNRKDLWGLKDKGEIKVRALSKGKVVVDRVIPYDFTTFTPNEVAVDNINLNMFDISQLDEINSTRTDDDEKFLFNYKINIEEYLSKHYPNVEYVEKRVFDAKRTPTTILMEEKKGIIDFNVMPYLYNKSATFSHVQFGYLGDRIYATTEFIFMLYDEKFNFVDAIRIVVDVPQSHITTGVKKIPMDRWLKYSELEPSLLALSVNGRGRVKGSDSFTDYYHEHAIPNYEPVTLPQEQKKNYNVLFTSDEENEKLFKIEWETEYPLEVRLDHNRYQTGLELIEKSSNSATFKILKKLNSNYLGYQPIELIVTNSFSNERNKYKIYFKKVDTIDNILEYVSTEYFEIDYPVLGYQENDIISITIPNHLTKNGMNFKGSYTLPSESEMKKKDYNYRPDKIFFNKNKQEIIKMNAEGYISYDIVRDNNTIASGKYYMNTNKVKIFSNQHYQFKVDLLSTVELIDYRGLSFDFSAQTFAGKIDLSSIPNAKYAEFVSISREDINYHSYHVREVLQIQNDYVDHGPVLIKDKRELTPINNIQFDSQSIIDTNEKLTISDTYYVYFIVLDEHLELLGIAVLEVKLTKDTVHPSVVSFEKQKKNK